TTWGFQLASDFVAFFIAMIPVVVAALLRIAVRPRPRRVLPFANLLSYAVFPAVIWEQEGTTPVVVAGVLALALVVLRRLTAGGLRVGKLFRVRRREALGPLVSRRPS